MARHDDTPDTSQRPPLEPLTRREALLTLGASISVVACSGALNQESVASSGSGGAGGLGYGGGGSGQAGSGGGGNCTAASSWASGGTAAMAAKDCYPDPFARTAASCPLFCETTAGPCTTATTIDREDVSEGLGGLPVRLTLRIVDANCSAIAGASVEIWHTQRSGVYSGVTPAGAFCYGNEPEAAQAMYFRGIRSADANGVVAFDSCFPGWYPGRAIHIHVRVRVNDAVYATSQLFFDDALVSEICASHPDYAGHGQPDTTNDSDNIIGGVSDKSPYLLDVERMADGAMLASKTIMVQPGGPGCATAGGNG